MAPNDGSDGDDDRKVKDLLDPATRADLERWFTLPSFEQLADRGTPAAPAEDDPEVVELLKRRAAALEAADPQLLAEIDLRLTACSEVIQPLPVLASPADRPIALLDLSMVEHRHVVAEPREYERSGQIEDDLKDCAPQALLRDLHRPELFFDKVFEPFDPGAQERFNAKTVVREVMATRFQLREFMVLANQQGRVAYAEVTETLAQRWGELNIPPRAVT